MVTTRAPPPRGPRWLFCPRSPAQGQRAPLGPDRRNAGRKLRVEHREHPKHRGSRLPPASWGQGGEHTRKSVEEGGWDLGGRLPAAQSVLGSACGKPPSRPVARPPLAPLRLPQLLRPRRRPRLRLCSAPFALVLRRPRQTCCEAAARVPKGWFGRGGGNRCWWRRPRGLRLCRAGPVGVRPGLRPAGLPCRPGPCELVLEGSPGALGTPTFPSDAH